MRSVTLAVTVVLVAIGGCGGATQGGLGGGTGSDGGAGHDDGGGTGGDGGGASPCPAAPPGDGAACGPQGLTCEWGASVVQDCDTLALCNGGRWQVTAPSPGGLDCGGGNPPGGMCPSSFASVPRATHCSPYGLYC
ncbi:MAG TPA: hypothetical protein VHS09_13160, partial [Polyangiaceae bacterium]|nr:hypothetical protein [Polyangiaceae bacterium]